VLARGEQDGRRSFSPQREPYDRLDCHGSAPL
jgi:hypothetical protein